jgi:predicted nuclease with TOPRIM domain
MSDQDDQSLSASTTQALPPSDTPELEAGDDTQALPSGYEVVVTDEDAVSGQVAVAEEFGDELISVQGIIRRYSEQQEKLNGEIKERRESIKNLFENNEELQKLEETQKTVNTDVKQKKQRIKESPEAVQLQMKLKELQEEMAEVQQSLSNHLLRYFQMTGSQVIEEADGNEREFSLKARLKGKKRSD